MLIGAVRKLTPKIVDNVNGPANAESCCRDSVVPMLPES